MRKHPRSIVLIDEYRTSKTCSRCHEGPIGEVFCHNKSGETRSAWALKRCARAGCKHLVNRDRNAAANMATIFLYHWLGWGRPGFLARPLGWLVAGGA